MKLYYYYIAGQDVLKLAPNHVIGQETLKRQYNTTWELSKQSARVQQNLSVPGMYTRLIGVIRWSKNSRTRTVWERRNINDSERHMLACGALDCLTDLRKVPRRLIHIHNAGTPKETRSIGIVRVIDKDEYLDLAAAESMDWGLWSDELDLSMWANELETTTTTIKEAEKESHSA
ncbi:hypothetical protein [Arcanobacterium phocae]|uniref:hypothetical protein n=1 Tax=Arcanobacterium phocae TaxID=131112 RepID=UPI001C0ECEAB|nr:hypothetical protein [Arcanobacterium phocae]